MEFKNKKCIKCNKTKCLTEFYYHRTRKIYMESCKSCNNLTSKTYQKTKREEQDIKYLLTQRAGSIRRDKKKLNIKVDPDLSKILYEQWIKQNGKCFYINETLSLNDYKNNHYFLTVDRIKPELGYVKGNVVLCCSVINRIKTNLSLDELFDWVNKIKINN